MKILRYVLFISILVSLFFIIYNQTNNNKKSFGKWSAALKTTFFVAAILAGLIPTRAGLTPTFPETFGNSNQAFHERLISQHSKEIILAKTGDSSPSFSPSPGRGQPSNFPTAPSGGRPSRPVYVPKYRTPPKLVDQGLGAGANPAGAGGGGGAAEFGLAPVPENQKS